MRTILVVDDEDDIRGLVAKMLRYRGFDVLEAESGAAASEIYEREGPFDLVVTDVRMDGESGPQLGDRLRKVSPDLKVLYISGCQHAHEDARGEGSAFLPKPFTPDALAAKVREVLASCRQRSRRRAPRSSSSRTTPRPHRFSGWT